MTEWTNSIMLWVDYALDLVLPKQRGSVTFQFLSSLAQRTCRQVMYVCLRIHILSDESEFQVLY